MTKSKWFVPLVVAAAAILLVVVYMVISSNKTKKVVTTTTTTHTISQSISTPIVQVSTITVPVTITQNPITVTIPTTITPTVTKTQLVTSTISVATTTTVTNTATVTNTLPPITTTVNAGITTTVTTPVTTTVTSPPVTTTTTATVTTTSPPVTTIVTTTIPPNMTFTTGLAVDGSTLTGPGQTLSTGFTITTGGNTSLSHILTLSGAQLSSPLAVNCSFTLQATPAQKTALLAYFGTMGGNLVYQTQIDNEVKGNVPFFYLNTSNDLVDGFKYSLGISPTLLTINDDYPKDTYHYTGTLLGTNNAILPVTITLIVN